MYATLKSARRSVNARLADDPSTKLWVVVEYRPGSSAQYRVTPVPPGYGERWYGPYRTAE